MARGDHARIRHTHTLLLQCIIKLICKLLVLLLVHLVHGSNYSLHSSFGKDLLLKAGSGSVGTFSKVSEVGVLLLFPFALLAILGGTEVHPCGCLHVLHKLRVLPIWMCPLLLKLLPLFTGSVFRVERLPLVISGDDLPMERALQPILALAEPAIRPEGPALVLHRLEFPRKGNVSAVEHLRNMGTVHLFLYLVGFPEAVLRVGS